MSFASIFILHFNPNYKKNWPSFKSLHYGSLCRRCCKRCRNSLQSMLSLFFRLVVVQRISLLFRAVVAQIVLLFFLFISSFVLSLFHLIAVTIVFFIFFLMSTSFVFSIWFTASAERQFKKNRNGLFWFSLKTFVFVWMNVRNKQQSRKCLLNFFIFIYSLLACSLRLWRGIY